MSKVPFTSLIVLCAAVAACSNGDTNRTITAPDARSAFNDAPSEVGFGSMADGPFDVFLATDDASALQSTARISAAQQPATDDRTSGHVGFGFTAPTFGLRDERYSFTALSTGPAPTFAAKGEFELMLTAASGSEQKFHGDVVCMNTVGNRTRLAGRLERVWINNVQRPITGATHVIWTVVDNGEGQGTTDTASPMFFNNAANAQAHCTFGFRPVQFPVLEGNVQVRS